MTAKLDEARETLRGALDGIRDLNAPLSSAQGMGNSDFWVTIDGVEYYISMRPSSRKPKAAKR